MKKSNIIIIGVVALLIAAIAWQLIRNKKKINEANAPKVVVDTGIPVNYTTVSLETTDQTLVKSGSMAPIREADINAMAAGKLLSVNFSQGSSVSQGATLATIDNKQVSLNTRALELQRDQARRDLERAQRLYDQDAGTLMALQGAQLQYDNLNTQISNIQKQLGDFAVRAPISGVVTMKIKEPGEFVGPGAVLGRIADISRLKVVVSVSDQEVYDIKHGQIAKVTTDIYPGQIFEGRVTFVSSVADQARNFTVEITIPNSSTNPLKAGTFAYVDFIKGSATPLLLIPRTALVSGTNNPQVFIINDQNIANIRQIVLGAEVGDKIEVLSGLVAGDKVVTSGIINLKDGTKVVPNNAAVVVK